MFLSDRDIEWAIQTGKLVVNPPPEKIDSSSFDLHLDDAGEAKVWDIEKYWSERRDAGAKYPEVLIGDYNYGAFSRKYLNAPPQWDHADERSTPVSRRGNEIIIRPHGFVLWQTKEEIGTPPENADLMCFVEGKSTKARSGIVVHLTAPNIHVSWSGRIVLEIVNFGPFDLVLKEGDAIAQATVARISSIPARGALGGQTYGQTSVHGS